MANNIVSDTLSSLYKIRKSMGLGLSKSTISKFFREEGHKFDNSNEVKNTKETNFAISYAIDNLGYIYLRGFVKFIGITGSVASGKYQVGDDIDLYIVVRNNTAWLYRLLLMLGNLFTFKLRRSRIANTHLKFCPNFIVEERALSKVNKNIYSLHEFIYMIPIYNSEYYLKVLAENHWMRRFGLVIDTKYAQVDSSRNFLFIPLNFLSYLCQTIFRFLYSYKRFTPQLKNFMQGKVVFYEYNFEDMNN